MLVHSWWRYYVPFVMINHHWHNLRVVGMRQQLLALRFTYEPWVTSAFIGIWWRPLTVWAPFPWLAVWKILNFQWNVTSLPSQSQSAVHCGESLLAGVCRDPVTMLSFPFDHSNGNSGSVNGGCYALQDIQLPKVFLVGVVCLHRDSCVWC